MRIAIQPMNHNPLRRTGPSSHQTIQISAHVEDDSATPKSGISDRITESSSQPSTSAVIFDSVQGAGTTTGAPFNSINSVYELPSVETWVFIKAGSGKRSSIVKRVLLRLPPTWSLSMSRKTVCLFISESLVPQDGHGIHICGAPRRHIARQQRNS